MTSQELDFDSNLFDHFSEIFKETLSQNSANPLSDAPYFIGMMGGTSLDGIDAVLCQFHEITEDNDEPVEILATISEPFPEDLRSALLALTTPNGVSELIITNHLVFQSELDVFGWASVFYAEFASHLAIQLMQNAQITPDEVSAIGCHGQTVRHRPEWQFSLQLLDPNVLAERTGVAVVSDFRRRDMAVGGQGAPLVPAFHQAMFGNFLAEQNHLRVILNLGGIANITVLQNSKDVIGLDTGVANLLLDAWCYKNTGQNYDENGDWAKTGMVNQALLNQLLTHPFFALPAPKSTGREDFNLEWLEKELVHYETVHNVGINPAGVQATLTELTAVSVANAIKAVTNAENGELFVCGGGAFNRFLISRLQANLPNWTVASTDKISLSPRWVEAVAFAWLARQTILNQPSNLPSVTGASKAVVLGQVCF